MPDGFKGIARNTAAGSSVPCDVFPRGTNLEVRLEDGTAVDLPYERMDISLSGVEDRYLTFRADNRGDAVTILVPDWDIGTRIASLGAPRQVVDRLEQMIHSKTRRRRGRISVLAILLLSAVLLTTLVWWGLNVGIRRAVDHVPPDWELALGRNAATQLLAEKKICSDPELVTAVGEIGTRLIGAMSSSHYHFTIRVVDDPDVNAFALPGGYVFVNRGLIEQATDGFEVAGVVAHELQHVLLRHGIHNVVRQAGVMMLLRFVMGDAGSIEQFLMLNAAQLANMSFSRDQESAADNAGLALMYRAKMDVTGLPRFLDRIAAEQGTAGEMLSIVSSHPGSGDRAEALRAAIASRPPIQVIPLRLDLTGTRGRCTPISVSDPDAPPTE